VIFLSTEEEIKILDHDARKRYINQSNSVNKQHNRESYTFNTLYFQLCLESVIVIG